MTLLSPSRRARFMHLCERLRRAGRSRLVEPVVTRLGGDLRWFGWFRELSAYYHGMTTEEFWVRYTNGRNDAAKLWSRRPRLGEADYRAFYAETDYFVLRQTHYHRHDSSYAIAAAMRDAGRRGALCEYGCGVAPLTAFLRPRFPGWRYTLVDLPTPTLEFARWRFREHANVEFKVPGLGGDLPLTSAYDVITCLDVLEHVVNPLQVMRHLVEHLKPGGTLFVNFVDDAGEENLVEASAQRGETIAYIDSTLQAVVPLGPDGSALEAQYVKPSR
jgi:SAM-dependent methyltransferase